MAIGDFMAAAANALRSAAAYGQLHSGSAGGDGTANVVSSARQAITWSASTGLGNFGLASQVTFTGTPDDPVYSITLWSAATDGTFYREIIFAGGSDNAFNDAGTFTVTALDFTGNAS